MNINEDELMGLTSFTDSLKAEIKALFADGRDPTDEEYPELMNMLCKLVIIKLSNDVIGSSVLRDPAKINELPKKTGSVLEDLRKALTPASHELQPERCTCSECGRTYDVSECPTSFGHHDGWEMPAYTEISCPRCPDGGSVDDCSYKEFELKHKDFNDVEVVTALTAPNWLTKGGIEHSTQCNRWFWKSHVQKLKINEQVETDFHIIKRLS